MKVYRMDICSDRLTKFNIKSLSFLLFILLSSSAFAQLPTITDVSPSELCVGETVTISGSGFGNPFPCTRIVFNGIDLLPGDFNIIDDGTMTFPAPAASATSGEEEVDTEVYYGPGGSNISDTQTSKLTINPLPNDATNPINSSYCEGDAVSAVSVDAPGAGLRIDWYSSSTGGTKLGEGSTYTPSAAGTYYAEVVNTATSCVSVARVAATVTEDPAPPPPTNPIGSSYCEGEPISPVSVDDPGAGFRIDWYTESTGGTKLAEGVTYTPSAAGTFYAEVVNTTTLCSSLTRVSATVTEDPIPPNPTNPMNGTYCTGESIPSIQVADPGDGLTIKWYTTMSGSTVATGTTSGNNEEIFTSADDVTATYYAETENDTTGCVSANRVAVMVIKYPLPSSATNPVSAVYCAGDPIPSIRVADPGNGFTIQWYTELTGGTLAAGITSGNNEEIFTPSTDATASYFAEVRNDVTGCVSANRIEVTVTRSLIPPNAENPVNANYCSGNPIPAVSVNDPGSGFTVKWYTAPTGGTLASGTAGGNNGEIFTPLTDITATYYAEVENDVTGCVSSFRRGATVTRYSSPANATNPVNASYCEGETIPPIRVNDPGNGLTVKWYTTLMGDVPAAGTTSGNNEEIFTPSADVTATYFTEIENDVTGCTSLTRIGVTVTKNLLPSNALNPVNSEYCDGNAIASVRVDDPGAGFIVKWYTTAIGDVSASGTSSGNNGEIFTPSNDVTATYYAEVENDATGCTSPSRVAVTVIKLPAPFQASNPINAEYCADESIPFIRVNDPGNGLTIVWYNNSSGSTLATGVTSGNNQEIFTPANDISATYFAEVQDDATGCGSLTRVGVSVVKNELPANASNPVDNTYCPGKALPTIGVDNPGAGLTVYWYDAPTNGNAAEGTTGGLNGEQFTPSNYGTATYYAEVENDATGCISAGRTGVMVVEDPFSCTDTEILSFNFNEQKNPTVIDDINHEITLDVRYGTSLTNLVASFTLSAGATAEVGGVIQQSGITANDFSGDVTYTVTAADGVTTQDWAVSVGVALNDSTDIISYSVEKQAGETLIDPVNHTIDLFVIFGTDLTDLVASFTLSTGARAVVGGVIQVSGITSNDFTNPVIYTVIAQDGVEQQNWIVTVTEAQNSETDILIFSFPEESGEADINSTDHTIDIELVYGSDPSSLIATFTLSPGATASVNGALQQSGITVNDFSDSVVYSVTAGDLITTQDWNVIVTVASNVETEIISYSFPEQTKPAEIDSINNIISVEVSPGTDLTDLIAYFILSDGATAEVVGISQESGITSNDFTDTLTYTITAEDGITADDWQVSVREQDIIDNENPVVTFDKMPEEYPVGSDSITASVIVTDNIGIDQVVFRYKKYQDTDWNDIEVISNDSVYVYTINDTLIGSHGMTYYFKAYDLKDNTDSTEIASLVLRYNNLNSPEIPDLVFGPSVENYQIISIPLSLENTTVNNIFNELNPYNIKKWRLYHYNNGITGEYSETFTTIAPGKGYWLIVRNTTQINVGAGITARIESEDGFALTLQPGWNQVGNPYNFEVSWDDVIDFNGNENINRIKLYDNGVLLEANSVPAFRGGFVFLGGDQSALVNIPPNPGFKNNRKTSSDLLLTNSIDQRSWYLPLQLINGRLTNSLNGIGMHPESSNGFDKNDEPLLPLPREISTSEMYFPHSGEPYEKLSRDFVMPEDFYKWEFQVDNHGQGGLITLVWENEYFGDNEFNLILVDMDKDRKIDMRSSESYTFYVSDNNRFEIYYGTNERLSHEIVPQSIQVGDIYPNPIKDVMFIPVSLPDMSNSYQVDIMLSDLKGNMIQQRSDMQLGMGYHKVSLNMNEGVHFAEGIYIVRILISSKMKKEIIYRKVLKF